MDSIKISVIMPVSNDKYDLHFCLESILLQNLQEIELICVNNGSSDDSLKIISDLLWSDDRIRIIEKDHEGKDFARYKGIKEARGEYLAFIDPNDRYYNYKALELLYNKAKENNALICGGSYDVLSGVAGGQSEYNTNDGNCDFSEERFYSFREYQCDRGSFRFIYDRNLILENESFFPSSERFQDPVWFVKALHKAGRFYGITEKVYSCSYSERNKYTDKEKVSKIITGITDVVMIAVRNGYDRLLELEKNRLIRDNAEIIYPYICSKDDKITYLIHTFEKVSGFRNIEKEILANIIFVRESQISSHYEELEKLQKDSVKLRIENNSINRMVEAVRSEIQHLNINMDSVLNNLGLEKKTILNRDDNNIIPYPYVDTTHEKQGIKWTDLGDGRIEACGTAEQDTFFALTPSANKTDLKTGNKKYRVYTGARDVSSFTWFISGRLAENNVRDTAWIFLKDATINDTDSFSDTFEIDTSEYDYFGMIFIFVKQGRTLDNVIFNPKICPID